MVESHGGITLATLRDVNLDKRCVALPRYIVYVYRPFSYSAREPGSSGIFIHFCTRDLIEWR